MCASSMVWQGPPQVHPKTPTWLHAQAGPGHEVLQQAVLLLQVAGLQQVVRLLARQHKHHVSQAGLRAQVVHRAGREVMSAWMCAR